MAESHGENFEETTTEERLGQLLNRGQLAEKLKLAENQAQMLIDREEILEVLDSSGQKLYPSFQINDAGDTLPQLSTLLGILLQEMSHWDVAHWLVSELEDYNGRGLNRTIADALWEKSQASTMLVFDLAEDTVDSYISDRILQEENDRYAKAYGSRFGGHKTLVIAGICVGVLLGAALIITIVANGGLDQQTIQRVFQHGG